MRITVKYSHGQALFLCIVLILCACQAKKEEIPVIPPVTSPLSRDCIGFGVITSSYTHFAAEPGADGVSLGYLRRGSLVRVLRRQVVKAGSGFVSWVLVEGNQQGWLREDVMDIYESENQARTAAESTDK
ncbi:MAG: hypothetical protein LBH44_06890 [Treponema sp.]|jgi:hypothetical protein|nr:hypothetical protein [Treponema sp.]